MRKSHNRTQLMSSSPLLPPSLFRALAPPRVRANVASWLLPAELAALAVATTSSEHGRGEVGDRIQVEASPEAASACSESWLWEVVPWRGIWTGVKPWEGAAVRRVALSTIAEGVLDRQFKHSMVAIPKESAEVGYTLLIISIEDSARVDASDDGGITWRVLHESAPFCARSDHEMVVVPRSGGSGHDVVLTGGNFNDSDDVDDYGVDLEDAWWSGDIGVTWELASAKMECGKRFLHKMCVLPGSPAEILLVGGDMSKESINDVWLSSDLGRSWECVCPSIGCRPYGRRSLVAVPDPKCVGMCRVLLANECLHTSEVWASVDRGRSWEQVLSGGVRTGCSRFSPTPMVLIPRSGGGGDVLMLGWKDQQYHAWMCEGGKGTKWTEVVTEGRRTRGESHMHFAAIVAPGREGWELVVTSEAIFGTRSKVWRGRLHA